MSSNRKILAVDFDGVLHQYDSGWQGAALVADLPVQGAIDWLVEMTKHFDVAIFSARNSHDGGVAAIIEWLNFHGLDRDWIRNNISFPCEKPPAHVTIDDRAIPFTGRFPTVEEIDEFQPWNKFVRPTEVIDRKLPRETGASIELTLQMESRGFDHAERLAALGNAAVGEIVSCSITADEARNRLAVFMNCLTISTEAAINILPSFREPGHA